MMFNDMSIQRNTFTTNADVEWHAQNSTLKKTHTGILLNLMQSNQKKQKLWVHHHSVSCKYSRHLRQKIKYCEAHVKSTLNKTE